MRSASRSSASWGRAGKTPRTGEDVPVSVQIGSEKHLRAFPEPHDCVVGICIERDSALASAGLRTADTQTVVHEIDTSTAQLFDLASPHRCIQGEYARKAYADSVDIPTLPCVEFDTGEEEALRMVLSRHRRSARLARLQPDSNGLSTEECFANPGTRQSARWGRFKGSSKLTEANVRKEIAVTAGVSEGNVTKFDQLHNSDPQILNALATGEIRIHRAWVWRDLPPQEQREELRRYRLNKGLKQPVKTHAFRHRARCSNRIVLTLAKLKELLQRTSSMPASDGEKSELIEIGLIEARGKTVLLTTELYETLWTDGSANQNADHRDIKAVSQGHDS